MSEARLDLNDIQGFLIRGYRLPHAAYLFLRIDDPEGARRWCNAALDDVLTAAPWSVKPESGINVLVTYRALEKLGASDFALQSFPQEFREGMAARAEALGDTGTSAPEHWEAPFRTGEGDVMVMVSAKTEAALADRLAQQRGLLTGLTEVACQTGAALPGGVEHFGFADGFAQPHLEGSGVDPGPGGGAPHKGGWRPIRAGEFILGYPDEEGVLPPAPTPDQLGRNGTFVVYRKLRQDVAAWRRQLAFNAALYDGDEAVLAAKLVGRFRDGTPLALADRPDPRLVADPQRNNAFDYADDPEGMRCPVGSHVRRSNPRLSMLFDGKLVNRHRIVRRGIPYGPPLPEGAEDDGADRGLIFMSLQASIARQFEFIQNQWCNDGNGLRQGDDQDPVTGVQDHEGARKMTVPGRPPFLFGPIERTVHTRGGEYFFCPGVNGLRWIAALEG